MMIPVLAPCPEWQPLYHSRPAIPNSSTLGGMPETLATRIAGSIPIAIAIGQLWPRDKYFIAMRPN